MPIKAIDGKTVGVLQAINKKDAVFNVTDEEVMSMLAIQAGMFIIL
jgi:hypothetical protein